VIQRRTWIEIGVVAVFVVFLYFAWKQWSADREQLALTLAAQKQVLADADAREKDRTTQLNTALDEIEKLKQQTQTPAQIVAILQAMAVKNLPQPIQIQLPPSVPGKPEAQQGPAQIEVPQPDLKPMFDFIEDCKACQARLTAAEQQHADDVKKFQAVGKERDAAITAAKGGSIWTRLKRNAKWFVIGAAAGAIAVRAHP
jgi:cytoskeletal protein RodZ